MHSDLLNPMVRILHQSKPNQLITSCKEDIEPQDGTVDHIFIGHVCIIYNAEGQGSINTHQAQ